MRHSQEATVLNIGMDPENEHLVITPIASWTAGQDFAAGKRIL
jgi:hypothetical protein